MAGYRIVSLRPADLEALLDHLERLTTAAGMSFDRSVEGHRRWAELASRPEDPGWRRMWGSVDDDGSIVGHIDVVCGREHTEAHRASVRAVVESGHRRRGVGRALATAAIAWCEAHPFLEWVDLRITDRDAAALALARRAGFAVTARVEDRYRDGYHQVAELWLARRVLPWKLREGSRPSTVGEVKLQPR